MSKFWNKKAFQYDVHCLLADWILLYLRTHVGGGWDRWVPPWDAMSGWWVLNPWTYWTPGHNHPCTYPPPTHTHPRHSQPLHIPTHRHFTQTYPTPDNMHMPWTYSAPAHTYAIDISPRHTQPQTTCTCPGHTQPLHIPTPWTYQPDIPNLRQHAHTLDIPTRQKGPDPERTWY